MIYSSITVIYLFCYLAGGYLHCRNTHPSASCCDGRMFLEEGTLGHLLADGAARWLLAVRRTSCRQRGRVSRVPSITLSSREVKCRLMTQPARLPTCASSCAATGWMRKKSADTTYGLSTTARQSSPEYWLRCSKEMARVIILLSYISRLCSFPQKPAALGGTRRSCSGLLGKDHLTKLQQRTSIGIFCWWLF